MNKQTIRLLVTAAIGLSFATGCTSNNSGPVDGAAPVTPGPPPAVTSANNEFLQQKSFDPWILTTTDPAGAIPAYSATGGVGITYGRDGSPIGFIKAGDYVNGNINLTGAKTISPVSGTGYKQTLDMRTGTLTTTGVGSAPKVQQAGSWPALWKAADIEIAGDPEAQQATRANLFYLLSSGAPNTSNSIPPMGLSSNIYAGHIFWDAEVWMFPALIAQHPDYALSLVNYRFERLAQAKKNAVQHHRKGAEYPWESADTGKEVAPEEFAKERHITADVAFAAWQYYLWTGDKEYLRTKGYPLLEATAEYWLSRVRKTADRAYHVAQVIGPDETAGVVDDDAWTMGVVEYNLRAAAAAAVELGEPGVPKWLEIANHLAPVYNAKEKRYVEYANAPANLMAKQANTQMLIYPLDMAMDETVAANTLDYCLAHTIKVGPAMTASIDAIVAAKLGRAQQSLDLFRDSYRPFMRSGLAAFSEKRTANRVYFCTGMGGSLQSVLYGFGGLNVSWRERAGKGTRIAADGDIALYANPHLPPGWTGLTLRGVRFHGQTYTISITPGNKVAVTKGT
ncbi:MAG TPA: glycosyl hydrolase family 65 protein [Capsulimonadaceae bacterium]|jgi:trehalose/maltose hydrolase-like predicted phosphorylase